MSWPKGEQQASEREVASSGIDTSDVASSGVRVERERETTPAPPFAFGDTAEDDWANGNAPSGRPTSVPDYDVAAVAFETSLRHQALPSLPHDLAVPTRTKVAPPAELDVRASFLLLHVDGVATVRDIADLAALPVTEVLAGLLDLTARGLVDLGGTQLSGGVPVSGSRRKSGA
ncbi:MAG: hypothetical protein JWO86_3945 [Myxococcaceae bacterium]|nr:hypothetical protein [Myxococcaceae bacterium]